MAIPTKKPTSSMSKAMGGMNGKKIDPRILAQLIAMLQAQRGGNGAPMPQGGNVPMPQGNDASMPPVMGR